MLLVVSLGSGSVVVVGGRRHGDECRADDAVTEAVATPNLFDDLPVGVIRARDIGDRLVLARVERATRRGVDGADALALEELAELAVDRRDAFEPGVVGDGGRAGLDRTVEVVRDGQPLADEVLAGKTEVAHPLLARSALEVLELGTFALQREKELVR